MNTKRVQIAGWKTADDWRTFRESLIVGGSPSSWQQAYNEYFLTRLDLRYFNPIRILQEHGTFTGEGQYPNTSTVSQKRPILSGFQVRQLTISIVHVAGIAVWA